MNFTENVRSFFKIVTNIYCTNYVPQILNFLNKSIPLQDIMLKKAMVLTFKGYDYYLYAYKRSG